MTESWKVAICEKGQPAIKTRTKVTKYPCPDACTKALEEQGGEIGRAPPTFGGYVSKGECIECYCKDKPPKPPKKPFPTTAP